MMESNKKKSISGIFWMGLLSMANIVIKLAITMVLSRTLNSYEFGLVAAVQILISYAEVFSMMGVGPALIQKKHVTEEDIISGNILNVMLGTFIYFIIFMFSTPLANFMGIADILMLRVLSIVFLIHSVSAVSESILQKEMKFKIISLINILTLIVYGLTAIILAYLGLGAWALVYASIIQSLVKGILLIKESPIKISIHFSLQSIKDLMYFGTGYTLVRIFNNTANQGDYFVVNRALGSIALGFYNRAYQILMIPTNLIGTVMDKVLFPLLCKVQDDNEKLKFAYFNITALFAFIAFPITIISFFMAEELVDIVLGSNWGETIVPFKILMLGLFFRMAYKIADTTVRSLGAVYKRLWTQIFYAGMIVLGAYIGKEEGINGVALATTISILINYIIMTVLIKNLIKFRTTDLLKYLLPIFVFNFFTFLLTGILVESFIIFLPIPLLRVIITTSIVLFLNIIVFRLFLKRMMPKDFSEFITAILGKIPSKIILGIS